MADSPHLFTLLEAAAGYALFEVVAFEEIGALLSGTMDTVTDLPLFSRAVKLKAFQPFASAEEALENANAISEHAMTLHLQSFLEMNLPKVSKKTKKEGKAASFSLGIIDPGLATAISEGIPGISCRSDDTIREILRGCRLHLKHYVKGLDSGAAEQAQLGLGHAYSRGKVKFNPARSDNMIIQSIALLDQMDKDLNTFAMRTREWYSWHFPELKDLVKDNYMFARCAAFIQDKSSLFTSSEIAAGMENDNDEEEKTAAATVVDKLPGLVEIVGDPETANAVVNAAKTSMGMACSAVDMINIVNFTQRMVKLAEYRKQLAIYLSDKMAIVAPNLSTLIGDTVAARLISKAGSLTNLAKAPASTVQILGAEKALFRALKTKGNTPKYGLIYHSTFIGRANAKNKGRISRYLANKCSIATRIDSFTDEPTNAYGEKLREQVEERLRFYETGAAPRKNIDVMKEVAKTLASVKDKQEKRKAETAMDVDDDDESPKKKSKKDKKRKSDVSESKNDEDVVMKEAPKSEDGGKKEKAKKVELSIDTEEKQGKEKKRKSLESSESKKEDVVMKEAVKVEDAKKEKKSASTPKNDHMDTKEDSTKEKKEKKAASTPKSDHVDTKEDSTKEKKEKKAASTPKSDHVDTKEDSTKEKKEKKAASTPKSDHVDTKEDSTKEKKEKKAASTPKSDHVDSAKDDKKSPKSDKKEKKKDKSKKE